MCGRKAHTKRAFFLLAGNFINTSYSAVVSLLTVNGPLLNTKLSKNEN